MRKQIITQAKICKQKKAIYDRTLRNKLNAYDQDKKKEREKERKKKKKDKRRNH
jgi:hypothetical protein